VFFTINFHHSLCIPRLSEAKLSFPIITTIRHALNRIPFWVFVSKLVDPRIVETCCPYYWRYECQ
jgi:hypothetical protein